MAYKDLRQYIERAAEERETNCVDVEVDWDLEVGGVSRRAIDLRSGAILFNRIRSYPQGYRIMANVLGPSYPTHALLSLALGLPKDTSLSQTIDWFGRKADECIHPIIVEHAPCKDNIVEGEEVDVLDFPVPRIHGVDGGGI